MIEKAPWEEIAPLSEDFKNTANALGGGIPFQIKRRLVRGLDYYNGLVFEVAAKGLGAQDALAGGGRYDRLYSDLGGKPTPCIGFSIGMERLLMALGDVAAEKARENLIYIAPLLNLDANITKHLDQTRYELGQLGMKPVLGDSNLKLENHLKNANKAGAKFVVILGPDELAAKKWKLKDMDKRSEELVDWGSLFSKLKHVTV